MKYKTLLKIQQGDVILRQVSKEDWANQDLKYQCNLNVDREVLQEGEETGHAHAIYRDNMPTDVSVTLHKSYQYTRDNGGIVVTGGPVILRHEEHAPIELPTGYYIQEIVQERRHTAGMTGRVAD